MAGLKTRTIAAAALLLAGGATANDNLPVRLATRSALNSRLANIHVEVDKLADAPLAFTYGSCSAVSRSDAHHDVATTTSSTSVDRLVWIIPEDVSSGGCLSAWSGTEGVLVGRSAPQTFDHVGMHARRTLTKRSQEKMRKRQLDPVKMDNSSGIDAHGPWFDGVAFLASKNVSAVDVAAAKAKNVAIVGAGAAGLTTYLVLHQAGLTNLSLIEASGRLGGRIQTEYLTGGPWDYSYQEMGPMRFPYQLKEGNTTLNISDHQLTFQLAEEINKINAAAGKTDLSVDFIPWIQENPNGFVYHNGFKLETGLPPTRNQVTANSSLGPADVWLDPETTAIRNAVLGYLSQPELVTAVATNSFKAHKEWQENGLTGLPGDQWSQYAYLKNYLGASLNTTDIVAGGLVGGQDATFWSDLYELVYFAASTWKTIDGGLSRLPLAFHPLVDKDLTLNRKISKVQYSEDEKTVSLSGKGESSTHDYAVVAVPFSVVKGWKLPDLDLTITNAIAKLPMEPICKVVLEYKTRFWEKFENPIYGGCTLSTDIPGMGSLCYPSYNINGTGPATILASYNFGDFATYWSSWSEEEHVAWVQDVMVEIHGDVAREECTGKYKRKCWHLDPLEIGAFTAPTVGQHELYIPEFFKTHKNMIFVGEHTSYTHAWVASAIESGIRGAVQLLLELGLVDEAKAAVDKWMARWMDV